MKMVPQIKNRDRWFYDKPFSADRWRLASYFFCRSREVIPGFHRRQHFTILLSLKQSSDEILHGFTSNTRYEVRRAAKDGIVAQGGAEQDEFQTFYDDFARSKNRPAVDRRDLTAYWRHLVVTKAVFQDEVLVMHTYLIDREASRVCLVHSASQFRRVDDSVKRGFIGRANRFLHFEDMLLFGKEGFSTYDLGGCSPATANPELAGIHEFKIGFGGQVVEESTYISQARHFLTAAKRRLAPK
jgi:lipid II:glycine glycyltransferase (peptidoglycan interpeptide bridge formation enzyme)